MQFEALQKEMIAAMKARDKVRKDAISSVIGNIKKVAIDEGCRDNISEELTDRMILKEIKILQEQIDTCPASRTDLIDQYTAKKNIIEEYAPKLMSQEEVIEYLKTNCAELLAARNKGMIMKTVMKDLKGKADGKMINQTVAMLCK